LCVLITRNFRNFGWATAKKRREFLANTIRKKKEEGQSFTKFGAMLMRGEKKGTSDIFLSIKNGFGKVCGVKKGRKKTIKDNLNDRYVHEEGKDKSRNSRHYLYSGKDDCGS